MIASCVTQPRSEWKVSAFAQQEEMALAPLIDQQGLLAVLER